MTRSFVTAFWTEEMCRRPVIYAEIVAVGESEPGAFALKIPFDIHAPAYGSTNPFLMLRCHAS